MATYKTHYHAVLNPNNCIKIFQLTTKLEESEFLRIKQLYSREESKDNLDSVLKSIMESLESGEHRKTDFHTAINKALTREPFQGITTAKKFIEFLDLTNNIKEDDIISAINEFIGKLGKLSQEFKRLFYLIITEASDSRNFIDALEMDLYELESLLNTNSGILLGKLKVLTSSKYGLLSYDEDEPNKVYANIWIPGDYNLIRELKLFCEENDIFIENLLVNGDFSLID